MCLQVAAAALCLAAGALSINGQQRVDPRNTHERLLCIVPMVGSGTYEDPRRPLYAPLPRRSSGQDGILAYAFEVSDDGRFALVEFVARDRSAFAGIAGDTSVRTFVRGRDKRDVIETEFKRHKKNFDFTRFAVRVP